MKIKKKIKISTTQTSAVIIFGLISGAIVSVAFGPVAGLLVAMGGSVAGILGVKSEAKEKANKLLPDDKLLKEAKKIHERTRKKEVGFKIEQKNQNKNIPFLGRLIYGDKETLEKVYYFKEDD